jgi:hypothetical protein
VQLLELEFQAVEAEMTEIFKHIDAGEPMS